MAATITTGRARRNSRRCSMYSLVTELRWSSASSVVLFGSERTVERARLDLQNTIGRHQ
jgi:hypothetical protein